MSQAFVRRLARQAAQRYGARDRFARHFAYGKLTGDPLFAHLLRHGLIRDGARLLDLGCGMGLLAAWLAAGREMHAAGDWPGDWAPPPRALSIQGIELFGRDVERARRADAQARFVEGDIRRVGFPPSDVATLFDVLHYIDPAGQEDVLARARGALAGGGLLLLRVADADGSLRFRLTDLADRAANLLRGRSFGRLHWRRVAEWRRRLEELGFAVVATPMSEGTPFANVLLQARYHPLQR